MPDTLRQPPSRPSHDVAGPAAPIDLHQGRPGAAPLWLLPDGQLSLDRDAAPAGIAAEAALVAGARWASGRRRSTFARLFPSMAPEATPRPERLSTVQGRGLFEQLRGALAAAAVGGEAAKRDATGAAQVRSAALTLLSHLLATARDDGGFRPLADEATATIFALADAEGAAAAAGDVTARPALRAQAVTLLQLRGPLLSAADQARVAQLLRGLLRAAPPYGELRGPWRFAMCSAWDFHAGETHGLVAAHGFHAVATPPDAPAAPAGGGYSVFEAPFRTPSGQPIQIFARTASPGDENFEMGSAYFVGLLINRHAQLGSFDMRAAASPVRQVGYKLLLNSQCAGLTTRFAITRLFPDADVYSSWDSTFFSTDSHGQVTRSEGLDCFVAILEGMSHKETHAQLDVRIRRAQWKHPQSALLRDFVQFVGPSHPLVVARFNDVNQDGRADVYDGFLDLRLELIAEDLRSSLVPRDPGVACSQISGAAASGLDWAAGSLDRVTQYSDLWADLPGGTETLYAFSAGGFYSQREPPPDVPAGDLGEDLGRLPAVCRYRTAGDGPATPATHAAKGFEVDVMFHAFLAHSVLELKRLLCAAEAMWRAIDLGHLGRADGPLASPLQRRGAVLLTLAGLLEFPADMNALDGVWAMALRQLGLPEISRSLVAGCITSADHDADNYYGSRRGLLQLVGDGTDKDHGALGRADPLAYQHLCSPDRHVGRAQPLSL